MNESTCPCGTGNSYDACCGRYIDSDTPAPTAEALMRSRYTAYVKDDVSYLRRTWDPDTCPQDLTAAEPGVEWTGLNVLRAEQGGEPDTSGLVEFMASLTQHGQPGHLHELSEFRRNADGHWLYVDGDVPRAEPVRVDKVGRNDPCPCGSGRKYKKCCGA